MIKFTLENTKNIAKEHPSQIWKSRDFEISIDYKQAGQFDETWQQK